MSKLGSLKILYVGPMVEGSTTMQRAQALRDLEHRLDYVNTEPTSHPIVDPSFLFRLRRKLMGRQDRAKANHAILQAMHREQYDLLWIDKGLTIHAQTLKTFRACQSRCRIIGFSPDDMLNPANQTRHFIEGLPLYDQFVVTKSYNVVELRQLGCASVLFMDNAFDSHTHRPHSVSEGDRRRLGGLVGFIGQWEPERAESLRKLAIAGIPVRVWGYTWERMKNVPPGLHLENRPLWGADYARGMCAFDINLCFLRKCNRDLQTTRSIEIPACGAFMLAERTQEHLRLFSEGHEAEFFADDQELVLKTRSYLSNPEKRREVAAKGLERCLRDGYSYRERLRNLLVHIGHARPTVAN